MKPIVFDIGANTGDALVENATKSPECQYFAFEPVPQLFQKLIELTKDLPNVVIVNKALSNFNGKAQFNIANDLDNYTVSSLLDFSDSVEQNWKPVIQYMEHVDKIEVDVIRLEDFVKSFGITAIEYFHCDAQGSDLDILKGLGDQISIIKQGCVEAAIKYNALYKNQCMIDQVAKFLESKEFEITAIQNNDSFGNEANVFFVNKNFKN
jgi:FkbM family methyltransferase